MEKGVFIHATAVVEGGAKVGAGTRIWHFSHLMPQCQVGRDCNIGQNVFIDNGAVVGDRVKIQNNVSVYHGVEIGEEAFIGPSVVFTNVINPRSFIERKDEFRKTVVGRGATIGANATLLCGISLGEYSFVGAGAVVTKNVAAFSLVYGNPARHRGWISKNGYPLVFNGKGEAFCENERQLYRLERGKVTRIPEF